MQQPDVYDVIIVGLGPGAITAAIYSYRKRVKTLLIGKDFGGAMLISGEIENWPGEIHTDGIKLSEKFEQHVRKYCTDISCLDQSLVTKIERATASGGAPLTSGEGNLFRVHNEHEKSYLSKTVIYATGRTPKKLGVPGEEQYRNRGVSYCAVCDGPLFGGKEVAVIGGGNSALEAVLMLTKIASHVTVVNRNPHFKGEEIYIQQLSKLPNVTVVANGVTTEIRGDGTFASGIVVEDKQTQKKQEFPAKGIFVEIGSLPITDPVKDLGVTLTAYKDIIVNRNCETNIPGFYAIGDVTDVRDKQIVVAAGMGCTAALSAGDYLVRTS
ncbi:MAG: alkyl hydroperoxide reductase subunit F [Parcubacteria group bacterium Gr01-1014_106]|nr:MAG: alkyl hydroperoxide reductase subunit F [Parcubacteria group bacterium Gr01-1014_106]